MDTKYIFVTGGVVSSLGKGISTSSIGALLRARGYRVTARVRSSGDPFRLLVRNLETRDLIARQELKRACEPAWHSALGDSSFNPRSPMESFGLRFFPRAALASVLLLLAACSSPTQQEQSP